MVYKSSPVDRLTATSHVVEMPLKRGPQELLSVPLVQLSIIPDLTTVAARITEPSDAANTMSGCTTIGVGVGEGMEHVCTYCRGKKKGCASGVGYCVLGAGAGGPRISAGFRVFSDATIATLKKTE